MCTECYQFIHWAINNKNDERETAKTQQHEFARRSYLRLAKATKNGLEEKMRKTLQHFIQLEQTWATQHI